MAQAREEHKRADAPWPLCYRISYDARWVSGSHPVAGASWPAPVPSARLIDSLGLPQAVWLDSLRPRPDTRWVPRPAGVGQARRWPTPASAAAWPGVWSGGEHGALRPSWDGPEPDERGFYEVLLPRDSTGAGHEFRGLVDLRSDSLEWTVLPSRLVASADSASSWHIRAEWRRMPCAQWPDGPAR